MEASSLAGIMTQGGDGKDGRDGREGPPRARGGSEEGELLFMLCWVLPGHFPAGGEEGRREVASAPGEGRGRGTGGKEDRASLGGRGRETVRSVVEAGGRNCEGGMGDGGKDEGGVDEGGEGEGGENE